MQFATTETQELLKNSARKFFSVEYPLAEVRRIMETDTAFDENLWRHMAGQGWMGITFSEQYDGMGLSVLDMAAALEEMGRALIPGPYLATVLLAGAAIDAAGNEAQKKKYLTPISGGKARATLALLEADANWDPAGVRMAASAQDGRIVLNGKKLFVPDAAVADFMVCAVRIGGELALVVLDAKTKGVKIERLPSLDETRKMYAVEFSGASVPRTDVLASGESARAALERALDVATVGLMAEMVGGIERVLEITVEYAKTRKQFGKPIGQFQAVQHHCADMFLWKESSRSAAYGAAWAVSENTPDARLLVSVAKTYISDAYREAGNWGIQVHGGMGFTWENDLHLYYRRAKASEVLFGDANYHRERIARQVIDRKREDESIATTV